MKTTLSILLILISFFSFAQNGIEMIMSHKQFKNNGETIQAEKNSVIWITENKMKISSDDPKEPIMMYDSEKRVITIIMRDKKQYTEISQKEMEELNAQLEESRKMMEQQLALLPESQREMVQQKMGKMFSEELPKVDYNLAENGIKVGPYTTNKYVGTFDKKTVEEVFIASADQFSVDQSYFEIYSDMTEFMKENMSKMMGTKSGQAGAGSFSASYPSFEEGIPVKSISYEDDSKSSEELLSKISEKDIPSEAFSVPTGFKKIDMMKEMKSGK